MIFSVVKLDLFIRALLLDRILALEKNTRTPRVHLVINKKTASNAINVSLITKPLLWLYSSIHYDIFYKKDLIGNNQNNTQSCK